MFMQENEALTRSPDKAFNQEKGIAFSNKIKVFCHMYNINQQQDEVRFHLTWHIKRIFVIDVMYLGYIGGIIFSTFLLFLFIIYKTKGTFLF